RLGRGTIAGRAHRVRGDRPPGARQRVVRAGAGDRPPAQEQPGDRARRADPAPASWPDRRHHPVSMPLFSTRARPMTVVGTTVLPTMSDALGLGTGAALTPGGMHYLLPAKFTIPPPSVFVRFRPGVEPLAGSTDL